MTLNPGTRVQDDVTGDALVVIRHDEETLARDCTIGYDFNMEEKTVADENEEHGYDPEDTVVETVYRETLDARLDDWEALSADTLLTQVEEMSLRTYSFPRERVSEVGAA